MGSAMTEESDTPEGIEIEITDTLDLHSFRPREVADVVASYLEAAVEAGLSHLRIIHGKGIGVQRRTVRALLERHPSVSSYSEAPVEAGGWGATTVILKPAADPDP